MDWQTIYTILNIFSAVVIGGLGVTVWRSSLGELKRPFLLLALAMFSWIAFYTAELNATSVNAQLTFAKLSYLGIVAVAPLWLIFTLMYAGRPDRVTRRTVGLLFIIPALTLAAVWTNEAHQLHWSEVRSEVIRGVELIQFEYGITFWIHAIYGYLVLGATMWLLIPMTTGAAKGYRRQAWYMIAAVLAPWIANLTFLLGFDPLPGLDISSLAFSLSAGLMTWVLLRYRAIPQGVVARDMIVDTIDDGIVVVDEHNLVVDINPAALRLIDTDIRDALGKSPEHLLRNCGELLEIYHDLKKSNQAGRDEGIIQRGKRQIYVDVRVTPLHNQRQQLLGYQVLLEDITTRKEAQLIGARRMAELSALRHIDARISGTLSLSDVLDTGLSSAISMTGADAGFISLFDEDDNIEQADSVKLLDAPPAHRIRRSYGPYPPAFLENPLPDGGIVGRVIRNRRGELVRNVEKDPDYIAIIPYMRSVMAEPLVFHDRMIGALYLETTNFINFQEEKYEFVNLLGARLAIAAENARLYTLSQQRLTELRTLYEQVRGLEQIKTDMIRVASHDLKNPLGVVRGYLDLFEMDIEMLNDEHRGFIFEMIRNLDRMERIITDILSLERYQQQTVFAPVNLSEIIEELIEEYKPQAARKAQTLSGAVAEMTLTINGDSVQLREASANLIGNAIKYTPENGVIQVKLHEQDNRAVFEVIDNGYGIPENLQGRLFQPFYRAVSEETRKIEGTGLGLHLVKNIIERHGGKIRFQSVHGQGSTFGYEMPLIPTP